MAKIEITILGTAAGIPTRKRAHPAIYLRYEDKNEFCYLFDCGEGTQRQILLADLNPMKLNEIFITHWHGDHCLGLQGLLTTMSFENREKTLTIYAPGIEEFANSLNSRYPSKKFKMVLKNVPTEGSEITDLLETDNLKIVSTPAEHGIPAVSYALIEKYKIKIDKEKAKKLGLPAQGLIYKEIKERGRAIFKGRQIKLKDVSLVKRGKKIVYSGDTKICHNLVKLARGANLLIQDCTYFDPRETEEDESKHATLREIIEMLTQIEVKKVILTHISRRYKDPDELRRKIKDYPELKIAKDFMRIRV